MLKFILRSCLILIVIMIVFMFILWNVNVKDWELGYRLGVVLIWLFGNAMLAIASIDNNNKNF